MSFGIYIAGYIIFIVGLAIGAHLLHASEVDRRRRSLSDRHSDHPRRDGDSTKGSDVIEVIRGSTGKRNRAERIYLGPANSDPGLMPLGKEV